MKVTIYLILGILTLVIITPGLVRTSVDVILYRIDNQACEEIQAQLKEHIEEGLYPGFFVTQNERDACDRVGNSIKGI